ncbi:MAG: hypothetical protein QOI35_2423 [Cryptosporangiaceae bacterium]|nr:hypothetical protein [Cryptosporangiaceae bacterium]MDQ1659390.1 hypothetical protein [Cryptosporangiaceae bacterium]
MNPHSPFTGTLLLPDRQPFGTLAPVTLASGEPVAAIRWHRWTGRARFDVLDAASQGVLAEGAKEGIFGRRYAVCAPGGGTPLVQMEFGFWGPGRATVTLADGVQLKATGNWTGRKYAIADAAGSPVAQLATTGVFFSLRPDSFALELVQPVLSIVQAAGLVQCIRAAVEASNAAAGGATAAVAGG